jgi:DNA polymerase-3 subunit epsilon/ATP-dependent DNA helicase DinG
MTSIVALDVETTGLDPQKDAIIEIGAVRFNGKRVEERFSQLINPGRPIPSLITQLTGITNDMVRNQPTMGAIIHSLVDFIGDSPVLGHRIQFDLGFLKKWQKFPYNPVIDTYELASVLMPTASRYGLASLCQQLGIFSTEPFHRAFNDAEMTSQVYLRLVDKAFELPRNLIEEFVRMSEPVDWEASWVFQQILKHQAFQPIRISREAYIYGTRYQNTPLLSPEKPLEPNEEVHPLNEDELASILEYGGQFSEYFNGFEQRLQQIQMLKAITRALSNSQHLLVEAGTGVGKSFAYLIPAAMWAYQNHHRVVISTNTINLQDQLIRKDIPDLCAAINLDLRAAVLKGRSNYLCPRRFEALINRGPVNAEEMRVVAKVMVWMYQEGSGDRNEINLNGPVEREIYYRISAEDEGCRTDVCVERTGGRCPFYIARQQAQSAHIIVINHALLLADMATRNKVLPEFKYLILDEGHQLEAATTNALGYEVTQNDVSRILRELGGISSGTLGWMLTSLRDYLKPSDFALFDKSIRRANDLSIRLEHDFQEFYFAIDEFLYQQREGRSINSYGQQERITSAVRTLPYWETIEVKWDDVNETLSLLLELLGEIFKAFGEIVQKDTQQFEDTQSRLGWAINLLIELQNRLKKMVADPDKNEIYWIEMNSESAPISIKIAPLEVGPLMEEFLWHEKESVILTSATLTTHGEFDYLRQRLRAEDAEELALGSPFDYETSALLYYANDIAEPNDASNYQRQVEQTIIRLARTTQGKMLVLFTSYSQLKKTSQSIGPALAKDDIQIYEQGEGASANALLESFRTSDKAVLLGTRAFWEGVDVPGEALSVLVIVKLPFDVPSDPIIAARSEMYEDPFNEYQLPEAILRFRQGFGRLIRTQTDRGVVVILDKRILTKRYGRLFRESLPECTVKQGSLDLLPSEAARWLNL